MFDAYQIQRLFYSVSQGEPALHVLAYYRDAAPLAWCRATDGDWLTELAFPWDVLDSYETYKIGD